MKKALLYSPYLDVLGGGERHILSMTNVLAKKGYTIDIAWDNNDILQNIQEKLHIDTSHMSCIPNFFKTRNSFSTFKKTQAYDTLLYVTDGSYFFSGAKNNYVFFMYPSRKLVTQSLIQKLKLHNWSFIANGEFTADILRTYVRKPIHVVPPFIDDAFFNLKGKKTKKILTVGRIFKHLHSKRQDISIQAFMQLKNTCKEYKDLKLVVAGGLKDEDTAYYQELQGLAKNRNDIILKTNLSYKELMKEYDNAMFYWHAAGYGINESLQPDGVEHFGITPLEAMASGCVTLCHDSGGPSRYIQHSHNGFLYKTIDDLVGTMSSIGTDVSAVRKVSENAREFVKNTYSYSNFEDRVKQAFKL